MAPRHLRHRRALPSVLVVGLVLLASACSSGDGGSSGSGGSSTTVDPRPAASLQTYLSALRSRSTPSTGVAFDSPAARFAGFLAALPPVEGQTPSAGDAGSDTYRLCGWSALPECGDISQFEYDANGNLQDFALDGLPVGDSLRGEGLTADIATGRLSSVGLQWAYRNPDGLLSVVVQYWWNDEISPETNGCDPAAATYSAGGPVISPVGGGKGSDPLGPWIMAMAFPDATLGGELTITCNDTTGATETFTINILG